MAGRPPFPQHPARLIVVLLVALWACGGDSEEARYAVVSRHLAWTAEDAGSARLAPLSTTWAWDKSAADAAVLDGGRVVFNDEARTWRLEPTADDRLTISGPHEFVLHANVFHALVVKLQTRTTCLLAVEWRDQGQEYSAERLLDGLAIEANTEAQSYVIRFSSMKGKEEQLGAEAGVERFRLTFHTDDGSPLDIRLRAVALVSEFDDAAGRPFTTARLRTRGVFRDGVAMRIPGVLRTEIERRGDEHLRFGLAAAGTRVPIHVRVRAGPATQTYVCKPGEGWIEGRIDLGGQPAGMSVPVLFEVESHPDPGAVLLVGSVLHMRREERSLPNVLLYVEDTLRPDRLGAYGFPLDTDPHLRRVAQEGMLFEHAYSPSNWTRPSTSSLMTSLVPPAHGNQTHRQRIPDGLVTLAETLAGSGYVTISLITNLHASSWSGLDQGYDIHHEPAAFGKTPDGSTLSSALVHPKLVALLEKYRDVRLFVVAHSLDPHSPYMPPLDDLLVVMGGTEQGPDAQVSDPERYLVDSRNYEAEIRHNDHWLALLDESLATLGQLENTLFIFTSDHGEQFGEHDYWEHHYTMYEQEVRIPFVIRWPGHIPAGARYGEPFSLIDVAPTIAGLLGIDAPASWQGLDISAQLLGAGQTAGRPRPILIDSVAWEEHPHPGHDMAVVLYPYKLILRVEDDQARPKELFDVAQDPRERDNLLGDANHVRRVAQMQAFAQRALDQGPLITDEDTTALMDPTRREWMRQMGYLR